jgi:3-deoxy-manno-octulosonate cytidylyltransferase (CMP-KDO synthetase)
MPDQIIGFIPARYASTRLPGKPLLDIAGIPMIVRVLQGASQAKTLSRILVLTDDQRIFDTVVKYQGEALLTPASCRNGTERIASVLDKIPCSIAVNIQGDEPLISGKLIDRAVQPLLDDPEITVSTLACPISEAGELSDASIVKVICDRNNYALYFSRSPIPFPDYLLLNSKGHQIKKGIWWKHIGLYVYYPEIVKLMLFTTPTTLETAEKLEQLRLLELGLKIRVVKVDANLIGVDTMEDLEKARAFFTDEKSKMQDQI